MCAAALEGKLTRTLWQAFVQQQLEVAPENPKLTGQIRRSSTFFLEFDRHFGNSDDISATALTQCIDSRHMRSHLLASRFVVQALAMDEFDATRQLTTEQRRVSDVLGEAQETKHGALLHAYDAWLTEANTSARTQRLYLRVAHDFCRDAKVTGDVAWSDDQAIRYLRRKPGQAANFGRFVSFCKRSRGWDVKLPAKELWRGAAPTAKDSVKALRKALSTTDGGATAPRTSKALARVLSLALDVPAAHLQRARANGDVQVHANGDIEVTADGRIAVSDPLYPFAQRWVALGARGRRAT